jgi:hypothetical protein
MPKRGLLSALAFVLKLAVTVALFAYLLRKLDLAPVLRRLEAMPPSAALGGEACLLLQLGLLALRWHVINGIVEAPMRASQILRLTAVGQFFNQVLPSGFAGDAARAWFAGREGVRVGPVVRAILCDRVTGLLVLVLMVSVTLFALPDIALARLPVKNLSWLFALVAFGGLASFLLLGPMIAAALLGYPRTQSIGRFTEDLHRVLFQARTSSVIVFALAVAVQLLNVAAVLCCAIGMHIHLGVVAAVVIVPAVMLVSMAPISVAGWGVREGAMIFGLGLVGISTTDALAVSVSFGLLQALLGVPGGVLWLAHRGAQRPQAMPGR